MTSPDAPLHTEPYGDAGVIAGFKFYSDDGLQIRMEATPGTTRVHWETGDDLTEASGMLARVATRGSEVWLATEGSGRRCLRRLRFPTVLLEQRINRLVDTTAPQLVRIDRPGEASIVWEQHVPADSEELTTELSVVTNGWQAAGSLMAELGATAAIGGLLEAVAKVGLDDAPRAI